MRIHPAVSLFAASLIALAPVHAFAQERDASSSVRDRPREEYDPLGKRFGGFTLNASVELSASSTDNVFAEEVNEDSDVILSVAPRARLSSNWSRHALSFEAGARVPNHQDFSNEDVTTGYVGADGRLDVGSRSNISASAEFGHEVESRTDPDAPIGGDPVEYDRSELAVGAQHTFNRVRVGATVSNQTYDYEGVQSYRDNDRTGVLGRVDVALTPRMGLVLQGIADERDYDNLPALNSEGRSFLAGVSINLTDLMYGEINLGQFDRDYDGGSSVSGTAIDANLEWYVTRLTTLTFNARRDAEEVGGTVALPYTESEYGARVDHELRRNIILTAGAATGKREYDVIDRDDDFMSFDAGVDYLMNRRVAWRARYNHDEVESDGLNRYRDFEVNAFTLGVSFRL